MSYLDRTADPNRRTAAITGVIVIHALLGYMVITGLTEAGFRPIWQRKPIVDFPVPTPTPTPQATKTHPPKPVQENREDPQPKLDLTHSDDHQTIVDKSDHVEVTPTPTATYTPYTPPVVPRFTPKAASPKNNPGGWALTDDYPPRDLREGNEGITSFRVSIGANGRVSGCEIVRSSGHPGLDAAACKTVTARARFAPATDENGDATVGTYSNSVRWQIPR